VIAITSESKNMQASMDLIWDYLLPEITRDSLAPDPEGVKKLQFTLQGLALSVPELKKEIPDSLNGITFPLDPNELGLGAIQLDLNQRKVVLTGEDTLELTFGWNDWHLNKIRAQMPLGAQVESYMAVMGGWDANNNFVIHRQFVEMAHHDRFVFNLNDGKIIWNESVSLWTPQNKGREVTLME
jgi:hypothetical protein